MIAKRFKAIIFDLDDTLFNTMDTCVRPAAKESCAAMVEAGLNCTVEQCVQEREIYFSRFPRKDIYPHVVSTFGLRHGSNTMPEEVVEIGRKTFHSRQVEPHIKPFPMTVSVLADLKTKYMLFLVTSGDPRTQQQKVELLKIKSFFNRIAYVDAFKKQRKTLAFLELLDHTQLRPEEVLCVGDRLDREIAEAKTLGMFTCQIKRGQYFNLQPLLQVEHPDFVVKDISELINVCKL